MVIVVRHLVKVAAVANKFSEYLIEVGFYFVNISDPNKTIYGERIPDDKKSEKIKDPKKTKKENDKPPKVLAADEAQKLTSYLQIANSIQESE